MPPDTLNSAVRIQTQLSEALGSQDFRWVRPENLHITVHFLGDTPEDRVTEIGNTLELSVAGSGGGSGRHVTPCLSAPGAFPKIGRARTLWIGIEDTNGALGELEQACRRELINVGISLESRPYRPHVTVGYARRDASRDSLAQVPEVLGSCEVPTDMFAAASLVLIQSDLGPGGSRYTDLLEIALE